MTAATAPPPDVTAYLAAVREALSDLPDAERDDLLAEVEDSLLEAAEEGGSIAARLGPPAEFAAELRSAAGLHPPTPLSHDSELTRRLLERVTRVLESSRFAAVRSTARDLAPIWWVLRAYLAVGAIAYVFDTGWSTRHPIVPRFETAEIGLALVVLAMIASVWLGLRTRRHGTRYPRALTVLNAALAVAILPVALDVMNRSSYDSILAAAYAPPLELPAQLSYSGNPVDNVYPYSRDGRLLHDVLLYDGWGNPLEIGGLEDPQRRLLHTAGGSPIFNSFPVRYFERGTMVVENPDAGPTVEVPEIATPPIR
jgi:hypothetical protein